MSIPWFVLIKHYRIPLPLRHLVCVLTCINVISFAQTAHTDEWTIAADSLLPWLYHEESAPKGILQDVLHELVLNLGHQSSTHTVPFRRMYAELLSGRAHLSVMLVSKGESSYPEGLIVGKEPLFSFRVVGVALKSEKLLIDNIDQLRRFRMGHVRLLPELTKKVSGDASSTEYGNNKMLLKGLIKQRIDVAITSEPTLLGVSKILGIQDQVEVVYTVGHDRMFLVWSRPALGKSVESLAIQADQVLRKMKQQGKISRIISQYSDVRIFGELGNPSP